ncbi:TetR/AcrR family transcriptional regulator [Mycobacterium asiaticum]|uniref:TetR family transcriptional regulator n=1 Tax=Mycobacterium asiaticum TaxID=1790 RepID=A0A1A3N649_MYCAS|nr:TetR/AcrR family transcriptional regulator [Mycobacterium asiaticum]OBK17633.1 TetR family transcriptional regulator [Mycobacterium asiaticum]OBK95819.1 TetR family transcriptional regulator [Mycobacterium asiaticum]
MGPTGAATQPRGSGGGARELRRQETRARLFEAALTEIGRSGVAGADVSAIAAAAGVVRGTFYFHFPTKEHVLVELERSEEARIVEELAESRNSSDDLVSLLTMLVLRVAATERQLGPVVFRDMLGLHFSATRPVEDELTEHPLADFVAAAITNAQNTGRVPAERDAGELTVFFLTGLFALLATGAHDPAADAILARYVTTIVKGMESR